ncbi:MAG: YIP1 family protein [Candidatus Thorarchaeota archaeon]
MSTDESLIQCPICQEGAPQGYLLCPFCGADLTKIYEVKSFEYISYKEVWHRMRYLFVKPIQICKEIAENPDSKAGMIFLFAITFGLAFQVSSMLIHANISSWRTLLIFLAVWIISLLPVALTWGILSLILIILSKLLGGKAKGKQISSAVGYGFMPVAVISVFNSLFYLIALPYSQIEALDYTEVFYTVLGYRNSFAGILGLILNIISFLGAGVYIALILKPANGFSWVEAGIAVGLPVIIFVALIISYYFGASAPVEEVTFNLF